MTIDRENLIETLGQCDDAGLDPLSWLAGFHAALTFVMDGMSAEEGELVAEELRKEFFESRLS